jgi:DEAD/DEAH box helicase domain-containing protein
MGLGEVKVIEKVTGYKKIKYFTHENAGYGDVHLPEMQMHTTSFWLTLPEAFVEALKVPRAEVLDAFRGAGAALETVATLALMCDPQDINRTIGDGSEDAPGRNPHEGKTGRFDPTLFLFDAHPGGVGLAKRIYERAGELVRRAQALIVDCPCDTGCPACIQPAEVGRARKALAVELLRRLVLASPDNSP